MFFDFGAGEIIGLAVLAMILIGPDKLPTFAIEAAKFIKKIRLMATNATNDLKENLGPGFENLDIADLNPKTFIRKQMDSVLDENNESDAPVNNAKLDPESP